MTVDISVINPAGPPASSPSPQALFVPSVQEALETPVNQTPAAIIKIPAASYDIEALLGETMTSLLAPPTSTEIPPTTVEKEKITEPEFDDLSDLLSEAGRRSSSRYAHSTNSQGQDSSDSQAVKLM